MIELQCRIKKNAKFLDEIQDSTATWEAVFAKILAWDTALGKNCTLGERW